MKKLLMILIGAVILLIVAVSVLVFVFTANIRTDVTTETVAAEIAEVPWYEITQDEQGGSVLTVRLPVDDRIDRWEYESSDESLLELLTHETTDSEYAASFRSFSPTPGPVTLTLKAYDSTNSPAETRTLRFNVGENQTLTLQE